MRFYSPSKFVEKKKSLRTVPNCGACRLDKGCKSPKITVRGNGKKGILVVGDCPNQNDDKYNNLYHGRSGQMISHALSEAGVDFSRDVWKTNAVICHPPKGVTDVQVNHCRPNLLNLISELKPKVVILLGLTASKSLLGYLWKEKLSGLNMWRGLQIPSPELGCWVFPTFHPNELLFLNNPIADKQFLADVDAACSFVNEPVPPKLEPEKKVKILYGDDAAKGIRLFSASGWTIAFDYETNMLKPDSLDSEIVCCAMSNGTSTIAFPWQGEAVKEAFAEFLKSDCPKVAANLKFEDRWSSTVVGVKPRKWAWDVVIAAHVIDNRKGITGLKFQSFARLGVGDYDSHVKQYLRPSGKNPSGNAKNQIYKIDKQQLLLYCGMDAYLEYELARVQCEVMGLEFPFHGS